MMVDSSGDPRAYTGGRFPRFRALGGPGRKVALIQGVEGTPLFPSGAQGLPSVQTGPAIKDLS